VLAVLGGVAGTFALSRVTDVSQYALNVVTLIGLGVAIDYSLFVVNRFREELRKPGMTVEAAIARSMATAGRAITFSGLTVAIGLSGMLFYEGTFLSSMGLAGAVVVAFAVLYGLTFLPALLCVLGPRVDRLRVPIPRARGEGRGFWHGLSTWVMRRPILVLLPVLAGILITASPFLRIEMANGDVTMLPKHAESRRGYDLLVAEFPEYDKNQVTVVVRTDGDPLEPARIQPLYDFHQRLKALPDVLSVESPFGLNARSTGLIAVLCQLPPSVAAPQCPPGVDAASGELTAAAYAQIYSPAAREQLPAPLRAAVESGLRQSVGERIVVYSVLTAKGKLTDEAQALVRAIRDLAPPAGAEVLVTGLTAFDIDVVEFIVGRTPMAVAWVMAATYIVLFLLLGSVILPLKAVVMNLLSIATSFGALVWIFQEGHFAEQLAFTAAPLDPTLPVILFCTVFGLSMDYEVLLLSRIQEEYVRTGDNTRSVAEGLERSGRLITGAAAIMVGVFGAFALAEVVIIKAIGLGMALAVAIDATLVRALVVPATMRLLGRVNWWAPGPLARLYRRLALGEHDADGSLAAVAVPSGTTLSGVRGGEAP
jgi:RND superfamily putative drug exporter